LDDLIEKLRKSAKSATAWCIFDNTAEFAALGNAIAVWQAAKSRH